MREFISVFAMFIPFITVAVAVLVGVLTMKKTRSAKKSFARHFITAAIVFVAMMTFSAVASAADYTPEEQAAIASESQIGLGLVGAALSVGLSGIGGGIALAGGAPAAIGATSEDPAAFGKALIFVALGEAVALYGFVIAFLILIKIPTLPALPVGF